MPREVWKIESEIRKYFYGSEWYEVYDIIEFVLQMQTDEYFKRELTQSLNGVLEREFSAFRVIDDKVAPVSNQLEFDELNNALEI